MLAVPGIKMQKECCSSHHVYDGSSCSEVQSQKEPNGESRSFDDKTPHALVMLKQRSITNLRVLQMCEGRCVASVVVLRF